MKEGKAKEKKKILHQTFNKNGQLSKLTNLTNIGNMLELIVYIKMIWKVSIIMPEKNQIVRPVR